MPYTVHCYRREQISANDCRVSTTTASSDVDNDDRNKLLTWISFGFAALYPCRTARRKGVIKSWILSRIIIIMVPSNIDIYINIFRWGRVMQGPPMGRVVIQHQHDAPTESRHSLVVQQAKRMQTHACLPSTQGYTYTQGYN
jgi:hypothetical protein